MTTAAGPVVVESTSESNSNMFSMFSNALGGLSASRSTTPTSTGRSKSPSLFTSVLRGKKGPASGNFSHSVVSPTTPWTSEDSFDGGVGEDGHKTVDYDRVNTKRFVGTSAENIEVANEVLPARLPSPATQQRMVFRKNFEPQTVMTEAQSPTRIPSPVTQPIAIRGKLPSMASLGSADMSYSPHVFSSSNLRPIIPPMSLSTEKSGQSLNPLVVACSDSSDFVEAVEDDAVLLRCLGDNRANSFDSVRKGDLLTLPSHRGPIKIQRGLNIEQPLLSNELYTMNSINESPIGDVLRYHSEHDTNTTINSSETYKWGRSPPRSPVSRSRFPRPSSGGRAEAPATSVSVATDRPNRSRDEYQKTEIRPTGIREQVSTKKSPMAAKKTRSSNKEETTSSPKIRVPSGKFVHVDEEQEFCGFDFVPDYADNESVVHDPSFMCGVVDPVVVFAGTITEPVLGAAASVTSTISNALTATVSVPVTAVQDNCIIS
jgi:hypothetical protein